MEYEQLKDILAQAVEAIPELKLVSAFPGGRADSPLKSGVCALGLESLSGSGFTSGGELTKTSDEITAFADIYTPFSKGGEYCCELALKLISLIEGGAEGERLSVSAEGAQYLSGSRAFRCRVTVSSEWELETEDEKEDPPHTELVIIDFGLYVCRLIKLETVPEQAVECCGEGYPVSFVRRNQGVEITVQRMTTDDGKNLGSLSYPFNFVSGDIRLTDCAVIEYSLEPGGEEKLKIRGREES